ncbi:MAG: TRAP transporter substrate-binding protein [Sphaerochaetaceae bacterium]
MGKRIILTVLLVLLAIGMVFAQGSEETKATKAEVKPIVLKYGHIWASGTRMDRAVQMVAKLVDERSGGQLKIENFPGEQLGSQMDEIENVKQGLQDMTMVYGIDRFCPSFSLFNTPFVFRDADHQYKVCMESDLTKDMVRQYMIDNHNIRLLNMFYHGPRMLTTNEANPVKSPADVKGLKLRCPDITAWIKSWQTVGANVTVFPWGELYLALKQNIVEAQENPLGSINDMKFYEVQKNVILTEHIIDYPFVMINESKFQSLGAELQKILTEAIEEGRQWTITEGRKEEQAMLKFFAEKGLNIVEVNKQEWLSAFSATPDMYPNGREIYNKIQAVK